MQETSSPTPIPNSYWVKPAVLLAGEYPGGSFSSSTTERLVKFIDTGIDTFIDLTEVGELPSYESLLQELAQLRQHPVTYTRVPMRDFDIPTSKTMVKVLDLIDYNLDRQKKLYIHCWGGVGRTGTTIGCYLVRHGMSPTMALDQLSEWWLNIPKNVFHPRTPETDAQINFIRNWQPSI